MSVIALKVSGASIALVLVALQGLTMYQLFGGGRLFPVSSGTLMIWHRAEGFLVLCLFASIGYQCVTRLGLEWTQWRVAAHVVAAMTTFVALGAKVMIVRVLPREGRLVPWLGIVLLAAALTTVATSVPWYLYERWGAGSVY